jgi:hypothetical protein
MTKIPEFGDSNNLSFWDDRLVIDPIFDLSQACVRKSSLVMATYTIYS